MEQSLNRRLGPALLIFYGVGIMVGAGIYVLIGAAAGAAGIYAPVGFLFAGVLALPTAMSYAELSSRVPKSAGEAAYVLQAFGSPVAAQGVGLLTVVTGTIAAAVVLQGGVGYLQSILDLPTPHLIVGMGVILSLIALAGVVESLMVAALFTIIEVIGLLIVSYVGMTGPEGISWQLLEPLEHHGGLSGIAFAGILGFFAFIGFEDLVNMAEETHNPEKTLPKAIFWSLGLTTLLYMLVTLAAVRTVEPDALAGSTQPLALVYEVATQNSAAFLVIIAVAAATNGVLAQIILAARVLYGLGREAHWLSVFAQTHPRLQTPVLGTLLAGAAVILTALFLPIVALAEATSVLLLFVFASMNLALIALKRQESTAPFVIPVWVPWIGFLASSAAAVASIIWV